MGGVVPPPKLSSLWKPKKQKQENNMRDSIKNQVKIGDTIQVRKTSRAYVGLGTPVEFVKVVDVITDGHGSLPLFTVEIDDKRTTETFTHKFFTAIRLGCSAPFRPRG